jgi:hypothetical protein
MTKSGALSWAEVTRTLCRILHAIARALASGDLIADDRLVIAMVATLQASGLGSGSGASKGAIAVGP